MPDLVVAGAGMAGLAAAAEARSHGAGVLLLEKGERPGGSMLLSSGMVWRHRDFDRFRAECPRGEPELQRVLFDRLDRDLEWLESLGARVVERETGNPLTTGLRFDTESLTGALLEAAGGKVRLGEPVTELPRDGTPLIVATGGFHASRALVREHVTPEADELVIRGAPHSTGDGLRLGLAAGAVTSDGLEEFYGRNMPAPPARIPQRGPGFVALGQLYAHHATVTNARGERFETRTWSETDVVQWTARQPRARAWYRVSDAALAEKVRNRTVGEMVEAAERAGAPVRRERGSVTVECVAGITTTIGGLRIDATGLAAPGVWACGADAGGIATGGYASGLGAALVFGRIAARAALGVGG